MFTIRPFEKTDPEIEAVVTVENAVWLDYPSTIEEMYFLNLRLGFEPQPAWLEFEKKMNVN